MLNWWKKIGSNPVLFLTGFVYGISYDKNGNFSPNDIITNPINTILMRVLSGLTCGGVTLFVSYFTPEHISPLYACLYGLSWCARYRSAHIIQIKN